VTVAYFEALRTKRLAEIAAESVKEAEEQRRLIQARIDSGDAAAIDIYPADVQLANAKLQKLTADNQARVAATALRNAMGLPKGPDLKLVDYAEPSPEVPKLEDALAAALRDRPEVARSAAQVEAERAALSFARLQTRVIPSGSLSYDKGLTGTGFDTQWSAGINITMNVFDGGAAAAAVEAAKAKLEAALLRDQQLKYDIATEVQEAHLNLSNAFERLAAGKANVTLAEKNLEVAREKYLQGLAIPLEVTTAQVQHSDAQAAYAQALYDCYIARAQLEKTIGKRDYGS